MIHLPTDDARVRRVNQSVQDIFLQTYHQLVAMPACQIAQSGK